MLALGLIAIVIVALILRVNIAAILLVVGAYVHLIWGDAELTYIIEDMWVAIDKEVLLSIPLFLLCGSVMGKGAIAERLIRVMRAITAPVPGGMALATLLTCAVFAAISGSSAVTLIAVGTIAYPALLQDGYSKKFALGVLVTGGTLGVIIPPSIPMILYGIVTETSIVELFTAGILPGLFLTALLGTALVRQQGIAESKGSPVGLTELDFDARHVRVRRDNVQPGDGRFHRRLLLRHQPR